MSTALIEDWLSVRCLKLMSGLKEMKIERLHAKNAPYLRIECDVQCASPTMAGKDSPMEDFQPIYVLSGSHDDNSDSVAQYGR